jgi:hypothetical protein
LQDSILIQAAAVLIQRLEILIQLRPATSSGRLARMPGSQNSRHCRPRE